MSLRATPFDDVNMGPAMIPLSAPQFSGLEAKYIKDCLDSGWVSSAGPYVARFETEFRDYLGADRAVATSSGTAALHIALLVAGVMPREEVLVPSLTFIAPVNAIRYVQAVPVFIDAEPRYAQMDVRLLETFLREECVAKENTTINRSTGRRVAAILPVHVLGHPVDLGPLLELAREFHLPVIEDASESLGSAYRERKAGTWGDISCFSFNGNKIMTTGGGGMLVTNRPQWADRARYLTTQAKDDPLEYIHHEVGYNYRLTNLAAALGCAQLNRLPEFILARQRIFRRYLEGLSSIKGLSCLTPAPGAQWNCWLFTLRVDENTYGQSARKLRDRLQHADIETRPLWQPNHLSYAHAEGVRLPCPEAEKWYAEGLCLPSSSSLTSEEQDRVMEELVRDLV